MLKKLTFFIFCLFLASGAFAATLKDTTVTGDLTVTGTVAGNGSLLTNVPGTVSGLNSGYLSRSSTSTTIVDSAVYQDANGNIGIGTSAPEAKLEVDGIIYGTNVGINTTAPAGRLEVDGNIYVKNASIGVNTTGPAASLEVDSAGTTSATAAFILNNAARTNLITVLDNGNVGIGTTAPTQLFQVGGNLTVGGAGDTYVAGNLGVGVASPTVALDVSGTVRGSAFIGDGSALTNVAGGISSLNPGYLPRSSTATTVVDSGVYQDVNGNVGVSTSAPRAKFEVDGIIYGTNIGVNSTAPQASLDVEGSVYFSAGNVGINTTGTRALLEVGNAASVTAGSNAAAIIKNDLVVDGKIYGDGSGLTGVKGALSGLNSTRVPVASGTNSLVDSIIYNVGNNVGIGTSNPLAKLDITGLGTGTSSVLVIRDNSGAAKLTMLDNGNIGIGTTSQINELAITSPAPILGFVSTNNNSGVRYQVNGTAGTVHRFMYGSTTIMTMLSTSYVGIGTVNPLAKLNVIGSGTTTGRAFEIDDSLYNPKVTILDNGNMGIGSSAPRTALEVDGIIYGSNIGVNSTGPRALLEVGSAASVTAGSNAAAIIKNDLVVDGKIYGDGSNLTSVAGALSGLTATRVPVASGANTLVDSVIYNVGNNVGIGTTNPNTLLHIVGNSVGDVTLKIENSFVGSTTGAQPSLILQKTDTSTQVGYDLGTIRFNASNSGAPGTIARIAAVHYDTSGTKAGLRFYTTTAGPNGLTEYLRITDKGNVGIGTAAPVARLNITGIGTTTAPAFEVDDALYNPKVLILDNGNEGVGTTGPRALLEVGNAASVTAGSNAAAIIKNDLVVDGKIYGDGSGLTSVAGGISGLTGTTTYGKIPRASGATSLVDSNVYQDANGNVGIGMTSPDARLDFGYHLSGDNVHLYDDGVYISGFSIASGQTMRLFGDAFNKLIQFGYQTKAGTFTEAMRLISGNVGIGTGNPVARLNITGTGTTTGRAFEVDDSLYAPHVVVLDNGNVGIGSSAPRTALEVDGIIYGSNIGVNSTGPRALLEVGNAASVTSGSNAAAIIKNDLVVDGKIYGDGSNLTSVAGGISGLTGTTTYGTIPRASGSTMLVDSIIYQDLNGNIGIGTTAPKGKLEVDGILYATSIGINTTSPQTALDINGSIQATGTGNVFVSGNVGIGTTAPTQVLGVNGVIAHVWGAPIPSLTSCGTAPAIKGTDNAFEITVGSSATGCTATFAGTYGDAVCTVTNQSVSVVNAMSYTVSASAVTITQANSGGDKIDVYCDFKN